ncbi:hypothetical protein Acr_15g0013550 [Actinidia rufa]|uniref:Uncharacterized protein n=1 Tax=Actinidia rufa TaxID=165716 RepID=A0A7J0FWC4_9ERIC|nr:hypothetical protein Acr_15g0013550 [Actinidia rufa]
MTVAFNGFRQIGGALNVEVKLAIFTVVGEGGSGPDTGVAGEFAVSFIRRGPEEGKEVFGVRLVVDLSWQFDARLVEVEVAAWLGAAIRRSEEVLLTTGTEDSVFFLKVFGELQGVLVAEMLRFLRWHVSAMEMEVEFTGGTGVGKPGSGEAAGIAEEGTGGVGGVWDEGEAGERGGSGSGWRGSIVRGERICIASRSRGRCRLRSGSGNRSNGFQALAGLGGGSDHGGD